MKDEIVELTFHVENMDAIKAKAKELGEQELQDLIEANTVITETPQLSK